MFWENWTGVSLEVMVSGWFCELVIVVGGASLPLPNVRWGRRCFGGAVAHCEAWRRSNGLECETLAGLMELEVRDII